MTQDTTKLAVRKVALFGWCVLDMSLEYPRHHPVRVFGYAEGAREKAEISICQYCAPDELCALHTRSPA